MLPIRTNIQPRRRPYANYAIIGITTLAFFVTYCPPGRVENWPFTVWPNFVHLQLFPRHWRVWQFVTYAFLHGGYWHILGNMFFLYLFGNNVNDKLGNVRYTLFYLAGAIISGAGHAAFNAQSMVPTVGASGAVAAVTGAYLVLFPQSLITVLYFLFFIIGTVDVRAIWFILFKMIVFDNLILTEASHVAYDAHLAGYAFGILATLGLLRLSWIDVSGHDLWTMIRQWNRRRHYREVVADGYNPFMGTAERRQVEAREVEKTPAQIARETRVAALRADISRHLAQSLVAAAIPHYRELIALDEKQILPRQTLLDIANQLTSEKQYQEAARAYEQFLTHYHSYEYREQVALMLGIIYARYLHEPKRACELLQQAADRLSDPGQLQMCRDELSQLE
ncbi:rhomboid family intramembrane serine protease [Planctomycetota bacterium]